MNIFARQHDFLARMNKREGHRVHRGLDGSVPSEQSEISDRKIARLDDYRWANRCRGLYQLPVAA